MSATIRSSRAHAIAVTIVALLFLLPIVAMVAGSFRSPGLPPPTGVELIPADASITAYRDAFGLVPLARATANSLIVAAFFVPITIVTASLAGYAIAQATPRMRRAAVIGLLIVLMIPVSAVWLTRFAMFKQAGLTDTYIPLLAPALMGGSPLFVLLYLLAFRRVPPELFDAARIEGATEWAIWRGVAMPLVRGTTVAVGLLAFALSWGNFIDPLLYLNTESGYTAPLVLRSLQQLDQTNWPVVLAGSVVVAAPVVVAFAAALRLIVPRKGAGWVGG